MSWQKRYVTTQKELDQIPLADRWQVYIARELFSSKPVVEAGDPLAAEGQLAAQGIFVEPLWNDADQQQDPEVVAYKAYMQKFGPLKGWIRQGVADRLALAAKTLEQQGYQLVLKAGYRPLQVQQDLFDGLREELKAQFPNLTSRELTELTRDYVSDPSQIIPPHVSGAAVDVIVTKNGKEVDMGCPLNSADDRAWQAYRPLTAQQQANRQLLRAAMLRADFAPLGSEWWHFSYGDQVWAAYYDQPAALYGLFV